MASSGTITIASAGTSERGPNVLVGRGVYLRAHPDNTQEAYVGYADSEVSDTTGYPLPAAGDSILLRVPNLNVLWFDANTDGQKICWILAD